MAQHGPGDEWKDETFDDDRTARRDRIKPVLVALDFSAVARHALAWAIEHAQRTGAELHTVHVIDRRLHRGDLSADAAALTAELARIHAEAAAELAREVDAEHRIKLAPLHEHVTLGAPADEIIAVAAEIDAAV